MPGTKKSWPHAGAGALAISGSQSKFFEVKWMCATHFRPLPEDNQAEVTLKGMNYQFPFTATGQFTLLLVGGQDWGEGQDYESILNLIQ